MKDTAKSAYVHIKKIKEVSTDENPFRRKHYFSPKELAEYLSLPLNTIYAWTSQRKVPYRKIGRLIRFNILEIEEWLHNKKIDAREYWAKRY